MDELGLTRRRALGLGAAAAAAAGAMAMAPGLAGAATSQDTRATITAAEAQALLAAAELKANEIGVPMYVVVVDESAKPKASLRMDGASLASLTLVPPKAVTAASFRTPTHVLAERVAADPVRVASFLATGEFSLLGGGLPVSRSGHVVGAIGVGGGTPEQDVIVGEAALAALGG
jgi:uncharacterized protein GlcG (DUF336 family)